MTNLKSLQILVFLLFVTPASAGVTGQAVKMLGQNLARESAKQTVKQATKHSSMQITRQGAALAAQRGAAYATRHFGHAATKSTRFVDDLARVSARLPPRDQRRLAMIANELNKSGQTAAVINKLASTPNAEALIATLWAHRGKLASAAAVSGLLLHGDDLADAGGKYIAKPVIDGSINQIVFPIVNSLIWLFWLLVFLTVSIGIVWQSNQTWALHFKSYWRTKIATLHQFLMPLSLRLSDFLKQHIAIKGGKSND